LIGQLSPTLHYVLGTVSILIGNSVGLCGLADERERICLFHE